MPTYPLVAGHSTGIAFGVSSTRYVNPAGGIAYSGAEARQQAVARDSYTLANLYVRVIANGTNASSTVRSRKNTANGAQSVSIGAGATGVFQDSVNSDSLAAGDLFNTQTVVGAGGSLTLTVIAYTLATASNTTPILIAGDVASLSVGFGVTTYAPIGGEARYNGTEARSQYIFRVAATLSNFRIYVRANTINNGTTVRTRKNAADGAQSVSVPASTTGAYEDTANSDSVASGDAVAYQVVTGGTSGSFAISIWQMKSNSAGRQVISANPDTGTISSGLTRYVPLEAGVQAYATTEANTQVAAQASFTAKNLFVRVPTNSINGNTTFTLRQNTGNSTLTVSVGSGATGTFEDTSNAVSCVAADLLDWGVVTGGTSGSMVITYIGFELAQPAGVTQKTVADALALADAAPGIAVRLAVAEGLGLADALPAGTPKALLGLAEALTLAEATPGIEASLLLDQALTLADVLAVKASLTLAESLALAETVSPKQFKSIADSLALADQVAMAVLVVRLLVLASMLKEGLAMSGTAGPALTLSAISGRGLQLESTMKGG